MTTMDRFALAAAAMKFGAWDEAQAWRVVDHMPASYWGNERRMLSYVRSYATAAFAS